VFEFKKPTRAVLAKMLSAVAKKEGFTLEPDAADLVATLASGSYRDALSVLQKVIIPGVDEISHKTNLRLHEATGKNFFSVDRTISREKVEGLTGAPRREHVHALIGALAAGERSQALSAIEKAAKADVDMKLYLELVLAALRTTLLIRYAPELRKGFEEELGTDEYAALLKFAEGLPAQAGKGVTHATMLAFLNAADRIRYAPIPALPLELAVLELFPE
jgi:DNA polymerase III gamma/tau subunit